MRELDLRTMSFGEAWNVFKTESVMGSKEYREVRFGVNIIFDINDYIKGRIVIKPKTGKAFVKGKAFALDEFETELEMRERKMKEWLIENFADEEIATPRGMGEVE